MVDATIIARRRIAWAAGLMALVAVPGTVAAQQPPGEGSDDEIVVTGAGLDAPPGEPACGSVTISRDRLANEASGRLSDWT